MLKIVAYHCPTELDEATRLLAEEGRTIIAGGTDLLAETFHLQRASAVLGEQGVARLQPVVDRQTGRGSLLRRHTRNVTTAAPRPSRCSQLVRAEVR